MVRWMVFEFLLFSLISAFGERGRTLTHSLTMVFAHQHTPPPPPHRRHTVVRAAYFLRGLIISPYIPSTYYIQRETARGHTSIVCNECVHATTLVKEDDEEAMILFSSVNMCAVYASERTNAQPPNEK